MNSWMFVSFLIWVATQSAVWKKGHFANCNFQNCNLRMPKNGDAEVILATGVLATPKLLTLSGIAEPKAMSVGKKQFLLFNWLVHLKGASAKVTPKGGLAGESPRIWSCNLVLNSMSITENFGKFWICFRVHVEFQGCAYSKHPRYTDQISAFLNIWNLPNGCHVNCSCSGAWETRCASTTSLFWPDTVSSFLFQSSILIL